MTSASAPNHRLRDRALEALRDVTDPEIGFDIVGLGMVYEIEVEGGNVLVRLGLTSAACPLGEQIAAEAEGRVRALDGVRQARVEIVFEPRWTPERMSPETREALGWK